MINDGRRQYCSFPFIVQLGDLLIHSRLKNCSTGWRFGMKNFIPAMPECQGVILDRPDSFGNVNYSLLALIGRRYRRIMLGANKSPFDAQKAAKKICPANAMLSCNCTGDIQCKGGVSVRNIQFIRRCVGPELHSPKNRRSSREPSIAFRSLRVALY